MKQIKMEYPNLYTRLPILKGDNSCPICKDTVKEKRMVNVRVYNYNNETSQIVSIELLFCENCNMAYTNDDITKYFNLTNRGFRILGFNTNRIKKQKLINKINGKFFGFKIKESDIEKNINIRLINVRGNNHMIYISNLDIDKKCPCCGKDTWRTELEISKSKEEFTQFKCYTCGEHIFLEPSNKLKSILLENKYIKNIRINFDYFIKFSDQIQYIFYEKNENIILIRLKNLYCKDNCKYVKEITIIISNETKILTDDIHILCYKDFVTRKLLTDIYYNKLKKITYDGFEYEIFKVIEKNDSDISNMILNEIQLGKGGGFYSSQRKNFFNLVDVLIFSPYTKCYEISPATYNQEDGYCFIDVSLYWRFIRKYGNPNLKVYPEYNNLYFDKNNRREESLLHSLGYSVAVKDNLSRMNRRDLLADIIDLKLISVKSICDTLNYCIKLHSSDKYEFARLKWAEDMEFVINYVSNPERFLILDNK